MKLDEPLLKRLCVAKSFKEGASTSSSSSSTSSSSSSSSDSSRVNSLHFSSDGLSLLSASEDDQIVVYDCEKGAQKRLVRRIVPSAGLGGISWCRAGAVD